MKRENKIESIVHDLDNIVEKIKKVRGKDKEVVKVVEEMKKAEVRNLRKDE